MNEQLYTLLEDIRDELQRSMRSAQEENNPYGPWLPAVLHARVLGAIEQRFAGNPNEGEAQMRMPTMREAAWKAMNREQRTIVKALQGLTDALSFLIDADKA